MLYKLLLYYGNVMTITLNSPSFDLSSLKKATDALKSSYLDGYATDIFSINLNLITASNVVDLVCNMPDLENLYFVFYDIDTGEQIFVKDENNMRILSHIDCNFKLSFVDALKNTEIDILSYVHNIPEILVEKSNIPDLNKQFKQISSLCDAILNCENQNSIKFKANLANVHLYENHPYFNFNLFDLTSSQNGSKDNPIDIETFTRCMNNTIKLGNNVYIPTDDFTKDDDETIVELLCDELDEVVFLVDSFQWTVTDLFRIERNEFNENLYEVFKTNSDNFHSLPDKLNYYRGLSKLNYILKFEDGDTSKNLKELANNLGVFL